MEIKTILVIEDDELNMKLFRSLLQLKNYAVLEAETAETGIQLARNCKPDLILMDIQLPGIDGIEATKLILIDDNLKNTPILAVSSFAMQEDKEKAYISGIKEYITKPIDKKNFLNTIKKYLN
jgi:two-component system cell cycle response regulator DivK